MLLIIMIIIVIIPLVELPSFICITAKGNNTADQFTYEPIQHKLLYCMSYYSAIFTVIYLCWCCTSVVGDTRPLVLL